MARRRLFCCADDSEESSHGSRPWVYFMIDCFFLVTQFFVITFRVRSDEVLLPQKLPPSGGPPPLRLFVPHTEISVRITHENHSAAYEFMGVKSNLPDFLNRLRDSADGRRDVRVRVAYAPEVPFADVMAVFNACKKFGIDECGLVPIH